MRRDVALIMMIQRSNFKNGDELPVRLAFQKAALEQMVKRKVGRTETGVSAGRIRFARYYSLERR